MSNQDNLAIVRRGYEAFGRGDIEGLVSLMDNDIEWVSPGRSDLPTAGRRQGHQQVREFFASVNELYDFQSFEPQTFISRRRPGGRARPGHGCREGDGQDFH